MLEVNAQPVRDLRRLIELEGQPYVERQLNVHRTTVGRWLSGAVAVPGAKHLALRSLLGDLPGTDGRWTGWRFTHGKLTSPAGDAFTAGGVLSLILLRQQLSAQERTIRELKIRLAVAEGAHMYQSANDTERYG